MTRDIDTLKQFVHDSEKEKSALDAYSFQLSQHFASLDLPSLAWSEQTFTAQPDYPGMTRAQIAQHWLKMATIGKLTAIMDPARGLVVKEEL